MTVRDLCPHDFDGHDSANAVAAVAWRLLVCTAVFFAGWVNFVSGGSSEHYERRPANRQWKPCKRKFGLSAIAKMEI